MSERAHAKQVREKELALQTQIQGLDAHTHKSNIEIAHATKASVYTHVQSPDVHTNQSVYKLGDGEGATFWLGKFANRSVQFERQ